jgi:hypothetical protein
MKANRGRWLLWGRGTANGGDVQARLKREGFEATTRGPRCGPFKLYARWPAGPVPKSLRARR